MTQDDFQPQWHWHLVDEPSAMPQTWFDTVRQLAHRQHPEADLRYAAQLLWQRGIRDEKTARPFLDLSHYVPTSPLAFGQEIQWAVERLIQAQETGEKVAIWGDFDADGVTATAVLWEGLQPLFPAPERLCYYIPNRFTESHGISCRGLDQLHRWGCQLMVTCDTGSTSLEALAYAQTLGIEVIVTDHHTLPSQRPDVVAMINPRSLPAGHPLGTLSGVAVAYKLVEALYLALPEPPITDLESLLDLVAIGLIADLVELRGDCRYLAQKGLMQLQRHLQPDQPTHRPGVAELLTLCKRTGDRPTDISFGLGPRINAVSRIHGDARFCVELLTSQDKERCTALAWEAELANTRRKGLQRDLVQQVTTRLADMDLSTTQVLVLADEQWPAGILGLVAGQIAQQYGRPTLLFSLDPLDASAETPPMARGSARSVQGLDLYTLFQQQAHLLTSYGGHPLAAGLSLPAENLPLLTTALNRQVREQQGENALGQPRLSIDLTVTVAELGQSLFRGLKLLEPYGMGNPVPRLRICNAWFERARHAKIRDRTGRKIAFIKTEFELWDDTTQTGFPGEWWDHYQEDLPTGRCDVVVELDHDPRQRRYHVRLVDVRSLEQATPLDRRTATREGIPLLDWRQHRPESLGSEEPLILEQCPTSWTEWQHHRQQALTQQKPLALAYDFHEPVPPQQVWLQLVGMAKYLSRTGKPVTLEQMQKALGLTAAILKIGLAALESMGFEITPAFTSITSKTPFQIRRAEKVADPPSITTPVGQFLQAVEEAQFRQRYFAQVPVTFLNSRVGDGL